MDRERARGWRSELGEGRRVAQHRVVPLPGEDLDAGRRGYRQRETAQQRLCSAELPKNKTTYDDCHECEQHPRNHITGVHAAAVIKSYKKGDQRLADIVYSGVPAGEFGLEQVIEIGPMSGKSNVIYWLEKRGIEPNETVVNRIYERAKAAHGVLEEHEILELV